MGTTLTRRARQTLARCAGCEYEPVVLAREALVAAMTDTGNQRQHVQVADARDRLLVAIVEAERIGGAVGAAIDRVTGRALKLLDAAEAASAAQEVTS